MYFSRNTCLYIIKNLQRKLIFFQVAWLRLETQSLLTIQKHLVLKNSRLTVHNPDYRHWNLHINDVQESDRGGYMCQVNTVPMKSLVGFLDVVGKKNLILLNLQ